MSVFDYDLAYIEMKSDIVCESFGRSFIFILLKMLTLLNATLMGHPFKNANERIFLVHAFETSETKNNYLSKRA